MSFLPFFPVLTMQHPNSTIVGGVIDATATLSPLLWAMIVLLLFCIVVIVAERERRPRLRRGDLALAPNIVVWRTRLVILEQRMRAG